MNEITANANFGGTWDSSVYTSEADDLYSRTVYVNNPVDIPAYTPVFYNSNNPGNLFFHYWGTMRYAGDNITEYDFSQPVTDELHLYAYWAGPIQVPVHAVDASAATLVDKDDAWLTTQPQTMIEVAAAEVSLVAKANADVYAANVPSGYAFAFAAVKSRTADLQTISEDQAITALYYNSTAKKVYVRYTDGTEAPLADEDEVYLVYYKDPLTLNIGYKVMSTSGVLSNATMGGSGYPTTGSAGTYVMNTSVSQPLYWANQSSYKYYVSIKNGHVVYCSNASFKYFTSNVEYILQITQSEKAGYSTTVDTDDVVGISNATNGTAKGYDSNDENRWFKFYSCMSRPNTPNGFPGNINGYTANDDPNSMTVIFTNTGSAQPLPAPTAYTTRHTPFILLLALGAILLTLGGIGVIRSRKRMPDSGPEKAKVQTHKQWVEYRTPLVRGAPPSAPPCPRTDLWAKPTGSTGKRGDPGL